MRCVYWIIEKTTEEKGLATRYVTVVIGNPYVDIILRQCTSDRKEEDMESVIET